ncbi:DUF885 family protein [Nocardia sp. XZ_19_369]|uniref:DUF885 domain-containing protein n=1 Tax=Nocardia sp. XZ_19_369 TaxID=2769487 RepID=UPI00188F799A|nr:DUF885 domain-containing protein [Nocardia sp. XZ_19_369]
MTAGPFDATLAGVPGYDDLVPDPSRAADDRLGTELAAIAAELARIPVERLSGQDAVTHSVLARVLRDRRAELLGAATEVSVSASIAAPQVAVFSTLPQASLTTAAQAGAYLVRLTRVGGYFDALSARYLQAARAGRVPVARGVGQAVAQVDAFLAVPITQDRLVALDPRGVDAVRWREQAGAIVETTVRPALQRFRDTLAWDLAPLGRDDEHVGLGQVPRGTDAYRAAVAAHTTTDLDPDAIHRIGIDALARVHAEIADVGARALGAHEVPAILTRLREDPALRFESSAQILAMVTAATDRARQALPNWFSSYSLAPCEVAEISPAEATGAPPAYYIPPATDGSRPGTVWVNTTDPGNRARFDCEGMAFHEGYPGHHLQSALAQTLVDLPDFRRYGMFNAYIEGWGLYTERLADEMGLYTTDLDQLGMLSNDAWRACRLVVDTGIHHYGWSRDRAAGFLRDNCALAQPSVEPEIDRYIAMPGQALSYLIGRNHIDQLRSDAKARMGKRFDIKGFHDTVLSCGPVPLDTLGDLVARWSHA